VTVCRSGPTAVPPAADIVAPGAMAADGSMSAASTMQSSSRRPIPPSGRRSTRPTAPKYGRYGSSYVRRMISTIPPRPPSSCNPRTVTADRGYGEQGVEDALHAHGVRNVVIPGKGKPTKSPKCRRTPPGGPTNHQVANRMRGQDQHPDTWPGNRGRFDSTEGARIWVGHEPSPTTRLRSPP
jgi:transposase, IS5 family